MNLTAQLENILFQYTTRPPRQDLRIEGWRFATTQQETVRVGVRDNKLGEVYTAPAINHSYSGDLLIIWPENLCSHASVNAGVIEQLEQQLPLWRQGAFYDPEGSKLLTPEPFPLVAVEDLAVRKVVQEDQEPLFQLLTTYIRELRQWQIDSIQAGVNAAWGLRHIRTSRGLSLSYAQTGFATSVSADGLLSKQFAKRRLPAEQELAQILASLGTMTRALKLEAPAITGKLPVIFAPELVEDLTLKYLLHNLSGNTVVNSQGAFSLQDFLRHRKVFDPRVSVVVDPLKPLEQSSYLCTREGLPAARTALVEQGCLATPYLTLKDSIKAGLKPTSLPQASGLYLEISGVGEYQELISCLESGLLVHSVLGLHTQDSTSGSYSLAAPQCLRIDKGKIVGRVKSVISANFLQQLTDPATQFALQSGQNFPAMQCIANVVTG